MNNELHQNYQKTKQKPKTQIESLVNFKIGQQYLVFQKIENGAFGAIYKAFDLHSEHEKVVAVKQLFVDKAKEQPCENNRQVKLEFIKREDQIMWKLNHPNILPLYKVYQNQNYKILITKYCNDGNLADLVTKQGSLELDHAIIILKQLCEGISKMHENNIIHRDLKFENIFIHNGNYIIGDFGLSKNIHQNTPGFHTYCGTPYTQAPEVRSGKYNLNADIYSLGVILFAMIDNRKYGDINKQIYQRAKVVTSTQVNKIEVKLKSNKQVPKHVISFIKSCLSPDPQKRLKFPELQNHPIFQLLPNEPIPPIYQVRTLSTIEQIHSDQFKNDSNRYQLILSKASSEELNKISSQMKQKSKQDKNHILSKQLHLETKIVQFVFNKYIEQIENKCLIDLTTKKNIELMYMLSSRCFQNISRLRQYKKQIETVSNSRFITKTVDQWHSKCFHKFIHYSNKLKDCEDQVVEIVKNRIRIIFSNKQHIHKENKLFNGIESIDYQKEDHIQWIHNRLTQINKLKTNDEAEEKLMLSYFRSFAHINRINLSNIEGEGRLIKFEELIEKYKKQNKC